VAEGFVAVAVTDDAAWQGLCRAIGRPDLAADPTLATAAGRRAREAELEATLAAWTARQDADAAMAALQAAGVAAGAIRWPTSLVRDPHLTARGFWQPTDRAWLGPHAQPSAPFREAGGGPYRVRRPAPTLGEDNQAVLGGLLGLPAEELARLEAAAVIGTEAVPVSQRKARAAVG
jgi:crotonobetainyl-CoA:carnitine CoA-transferase CaiB-like acyl-CoA transferase